MKFVILMHTHRPFASHLLTGLFAAVLFVALPASSAVPPTLSALMQQKADPWVVKKLADGSTSEFLVVLPEQADLSGAAQFTDKTARGQWVFETLRDNAKRSQASLLTWLAARGVEHRPFWVANMVLVRADAAVANELAKRVDVARLAANPNVRMPSPPQEEREARAKSTEATDATTAIEAGVTKIRAPEMWTAGFTGQGIVIAGADTGYDWTHPAIQGKYRGWNGVSANHNYHWHDAIDAVGFPGGGGVCGLSSLVPCDDGDHGTHTMGTMVGASGVNEIGVAPGAKWIGCRNMDQGNGTPATYTECFQWFIAPTMLNGTNPDPSKAPHVINNSWGCPPSEGCTDVNVLRTVVESVRAAGIVVVVSAGNAGSACSTVNDPAAIYEASFSVGATISASDNLASFSSRGPVTVDGSNRMKPNISAPGVNVRSSLPGGVYGSKNGTSMAGPHVAGGVALLMSAYPALVGQPGLVQTRLERSAVQRTATVNCGGTGTAAPNNEFGWGRLDVKAAYDAPFATLDVDNNGVSEASKDGVLIVRYLLGMRGSALTSGVIGAGARRSSTVAIETYLGTLLL